MVLDSLKHPSNWRVADLERDQRWVFRIDEATRQEMIDAVLKAEDPNKSLLDYRQTDFALSKTLITLSAALEEVKRGLGVALIKGLPRQELTARQFEIFLVPRCDRIALGLDPSLGSGHNLIQGYNFMHDAQRFCFCRIDRLAF
jgi:hypothetical protein